MQRNARMMSFTLTSPPPKLCEVLNPWSVLSCACTSHIPAYVRQCPFLCLHSLQLSYFSSLLPSL
ncbi:hypothetical protein BCR43DRAFT_481857, partial [Syncephalastrum racemosum]